MSFDLRFTKGQGTGNDFVLFSDPEGETELTPTQIAAVVRPPVRRRRRRRHPRRALAQPRRRRRGARGGPVGGVVHGLLERRRHASSEMCGNGIRVFTSYLLDQGLAELADRRRARRSARGRACARVQPHARTASRPTSGAWRLDGGEPLVRAKSLPVARPGLGIDVGNPHVVVALADDDELDGARPRLPARCSIPLPEARRERRVRGARRPARRGRRRPHPHARARARVGRDPLLRHRRGRRGPRGAALGRRRRTERLARRGAGRRARRADVPGRRRRARRAERARPSSSSTECSASPRRAAISIGASVPGSARARRSTRKPL